MTSHIELVAILLALVGTVPCAAARELLVKIGERDLPLKLNSQIKATNNENKAVGTLTLSNPSKQPIQVGALQYDFRFSQSFEHIDSSTKERYIWQGHKDDIRQITTFDTCGSTKLPTTVAPGASISCPFSARMNLYGGDISVVAAAFDISVPKEEVSIGRDGQIAFDVLNVAAYDAKVIRPFESDSSGWKKKYTANKDKAIPVHDIECEEGQQYCKVCGGQAAVEAKCNQVNICVAYDMEDKNCGYLKQARGPTTTKPGFVSYVAA